MADYNKDRWGETFPGTVSNEERPKDGIDNSLSFETDKFPQRIASDPVRYDLENAFGKQLFSNDQRLKDEIDANKKSTDDALDAHKKDPKAHTNGIAGNAASATKLQTARKIGGVSFNGTADITLPGVNTKGNQDTSGKAATAGTADTAANANKLASESGSNYLEIDSKEDSWSVIGSNPGSWLKSIKTKGSAPPYSLGNNSAAVAFGRGDTKGIITHAYNEPLVKFAGGNGSTARWKFSIKGGSNKEVYDLNNFPTKTGDGASGTWGIDISGNAATATKLAAPRTISLTGNATGSATFDGSGDVSIDTTVSQATAANALNSMGNKTAITDGTREPLNLSLYQVYNNGYPVSYGNLLSIGGVGGGELLAEWRGVEKGIGHLYYRNRRDAGNIWSDWSTVAFTSDINRFAPTKTGDGASGTWGINISGNADNADKVDGYHASDIIGKIYPVGSIYISVSGTNPASLFGIGTWVEVGQGRTLWGADSSHAAGSTIEAGLPNITGTLDANSNDGTKWKTGAFYDTGSRADGADGDNDGGIIAFDASRSNAIYGKSSTVQPPALVVHFWKRTA